MEIILLEKIRNLGGVGSKVNVKPGFARNFLIPQGKAVTATAANLAKFEARRLELEKAAAEVLAKAQKRAEKYQDLSFTLKARAAEEGKIFGSIGTREIVKALNDAGYDVIKSEISLPQGSIRRTGEYNIALILHSDVIVTIKLNVVPEEITS